MDANVNGVMPVFDMNRTGDGYGYGGGWFMWILVLFVLMGGNGAWNNRVGDVATTRDVYASNDFQSLRTAVNNLGNGIADATFSLSRDINQNACMLDKSIMQGNYAVEKSITDARYVLADGIGQNRFAAQQGFNGVDRNIDAVRYENAMNTCKITTTDTENTQKILDKLGQMEFNAMKAENENLRMALANERNINVNYMQTRDIIGAVRPFPVPAFPVGNPYGNSSCNCGVNYGCQ